MQYNFPNLARRGELELARGRNIEGTRGPENKCSVEIHLRSWWHGNMLLLTSEKEEDERTKNYVLKALHQIRKVIGK